MSKEPKEQSLTITSSTSLSTGGSFMPSNLDQAVTVAKMIAHSGMVPKQYDGNTGAVLIAIQMGAEIGLTPMSAIQNIAVINGRPSLWGDAMLALVLSHPDCEDVIEDDMETIAKAKMATCVVKRRGKTAVSRTFSMADAERAGLLKKSPSPWQSYPYRMLQMRARGFALRDSFPDALRGVHLAEEARDLPEATVVLTPEWREENEPQQLEEPPKSKTSRTKETLEARRAKKEPEPKKKKESEKKEEPATARYDDVGPPAMTDEEIAQMEPADNGAGF